MSRLIIVPLDATENAPLLSLSQSKANGMNANVINSRYVVVDSYVVKQHKVDLRQPQVRLHIYLGGKGLNIWVWHLNYQGQCRLPRSSGIKGSVSLCKLCLISTIIGKTA